MESKHKRRRKICFTYNIALAIMHDEDHKSKVSLRKQLADMERHNLVKIR